MTPVALLVVFCAVMAGIALVRLAYVDDRDLVDVGNALIVCAIAFVTVWWVGRRESWFSAGWGLVLLLVGIVLVCAGSVLLVTDWTERSGFRGENEPDLDEDGDRTPD
ncbi:hypothetical protein [Natrarchaeobius halalkaliphilus]|uniref:hypothetical protein n=1 Tax=Natrarchaeobius halalkaliphilus TaxID=1679091 RepID=UPI001A9EE29C|nr:hypothetical protein [Natrarchaeobius halalkaliphilus]